MRRWPLFVIASPAMVAIWSGWVSLGEMCGFGLVQPFPGIVPWRLNTAITLPVGVEAYAPWPVIAAVACLPVITLGFGAALAHLLHADATVPAAEEPTAEEEEVVKPIVNRPSVLPADLVIQARAINAKHRLAHCGKPISRDNLKLALGIATDKATTLIHVIRTQHEALAATRPDRQEATADFPSAA